MRLFHRVMAKGMFNGQRMCQVVDMTRQVRLMLGWAIVSPRLPLHMLGARARARLRLHPSIHINILAHLRCGAKMRAIATRATMTHEGYLLDVHTRDSVVVGRDGFWRWISFILCLNAP